MPYRENIKEPFDPEMHEHDKGEKSYVRKSALANDQLAHHEAGRRNREEKSWFKKLFGHTVTGLDVVREQAVNDHVGKLKFTTTSIVLQTPEGIRGEFNGIKIDINLESGGTVDGEKISPVDAKFILKVLKPLIKENMSNLKDAHKRKEKRGTEAGEKAVNRLMGPSVHNKLPEAVEPKQLAPHVEDVHEPENK